MLASARGVAQPPWWRRRRVVLALAVLLGVLAVGNVVMWVSMPHHVHRGVAWGRLAYGMARRGVHMPCSQRAFTEECGSISLDISMSNAWQAVSEWAGGGDVAMPACRVDEGWHRVQTFHVPRSVFGEYDPSHDLELVWDVHVSAQRTERLAWAEVWIDGVGASAAFLHASEHVSLSLLVPQSAWRGRSDALAVHVAVHVCGGPSDLAMPQVLPSAGLFLCSRAPVSASWITTTAPLVYVGEDPGTMHFVWSSNCPYVTHSVSLEEPRTPATASSDDGADADAPPPTRVRYDVTTVQTIKLDEAHAVHRATLTNIPAGEFVFHEVLGTRTLLSMRVADLVAPPRRPLRVGLISDSQSGAVVYEHQLAHMKEHQVDIVVHGGDRVTDVSEWDVYWQQPTARVLTSTVRPSVPLATCMGNHDNNAGGWAYTPVVGADTFNFARRVGGLLLVVTYWDCDHLEDVHQTAWLERVLRHARGASGSDIQRIVVVVHMPPFLEFWKPAAWEAGDKYWGVHVREVWGAILRDYAVDMVVSGHSHLYQRGERDGVTFVTLGGGGGVLEAPEHRVADHNMFEVTRFEHSYGVLEVRGADDNHALVLSVYSDGDNLIDSVRVGA